MMESEYNPMNYGRGIFPQDEKSTKEVRDMLDLEAKDHNTTDYAVAEVASVKADDFDLLRDRAILARTRGTKEKPGLNGIGGVIV